MKTWTCPFCQRPQLAQADQNAAGRWPLGVASSRYSQPGIAFTATACSAPDCGEIALKLVFGEGAFPTQGYTIIRAHETFTLRPLGAAKPKQPYIKDVIYEDYREACAIRDLSPKAAATLVRRCLQGMVRDFCGISRGTLDAEIKALKAALESGAAPPGVSAETIDAIDHVRSIGNIGAHMERDVDAVIPVEPGEVEALIALVEMLFEDWYGALHQRQLRLARVKEIASEKKALRSPVASQGPLLTGPAQDEAASETE